MGLFDRLMQPQAAPRRNLMDTQMVRRPSESYLRQDYPMVYGALGGLFGTAPDEMAGSVLDPNTAAVRRGAEYGFPVGTALAMLPAAGLTKGLPVGMGIKDVGRTGLPSPKSLTMPSVPTVDQMKQYGRTEVVPLSKAVSFQSARNWEKFKEGKGPGDLVAGYGDKPLALRLETGEYVIYDGNHRTDLALQKGKTELPMHVIDVKSYDPAHAGRKPVPLSMSDDELLNSLLGDNRQQSPYPQQAALDLAQQRAALPVSQGGLGLPAGNTAEQRAAAMGFNTDAYHGTNISNITKFDLGKSSRGEGTSVALTPENAQAYGNITYPLKVNQQKIFDPTNKDQFNELKSYVENLIQKQKPYDKDSLSFYPFTSKKVLENLANPQTGSYYLENELISKSLQDLGYSGSIGMESGQSQLKMFDPDQIRSRFAAFDPFRRSAAIAATMGVAAPDLLANELDYPSNPMYTDPLGYSIR